MKQKSKNQKEANELIKHTKAWVMKQDQKTLESMIETHWLKRAAAGIAAAVMLTISAGTAKAADNFSYGVMYEKKGQTYEAKQPVTTLGTQVTGSTNKEIGTNIGNGVVIDKDGKYVGTMIDYFQNEKNAREQIRKQSQTATSPQDDYNAKMREYETLAQRNPQEAIDLAGKELSAGRLKQAETIYATLSTLHGQNKINLEPKQVKIITQGYNSTQIYKKHYPELYK